MFVLIFGLIILIYTALNYYIGIRLIEGIKYFLPNINNKVYWAVFWLVAFSYLFGRVLRNVLSYNHSNILTLIGSYWLGITFYSILVLSLLDIVRLINKYTGFIPENIKSNLVFAQVISGIIFITIIGIIVLGVINSKEIKVVPYNVKISKSAGDIKKLRIVAMSDIHLGIIVNEKRIQKAANIINSLNPDLVLLVGDIVDEDINIFKEKDMVKIFGGIKSKYGKFAVLGNHEYIGGHTDEAIHYIEESGFKLLKDNYDIISGNLYIVGRDDLSSQRFGNNPRKELGQILNSVDKGKPIILLDHQPSKLDEAMENGVDLQLSGHTHRGQLFPSALITDMLFENDWGHLIKGNFNSIVSSGFGTWGPPIRIGSHSEILDINIEFE